MISLKEYKAWQEAEQETLAADKSTPEEEDWDTDPPQPPQEPPPPPGAGSMAPSQEDKWKRMINQDPYSGSITGDSGHSTLTVTKETESMEEAGELTGEVGGVDEYLCRIPLRCRMEGT